MPALLSRQKVIVTLLILLGLLLLAFLLAVNFVRSGRMDRWITGKAVEVLKEYGVRAEIGSLQTSISGRSVQLRDITLSSAESGEPFIKLKEATATLSIPGFTSLIGFGAKDDITLQKLLIDGITATYKIDASGKSNLAGIRLPEADPGKKRQFSTSFTVVEVRQAEVHYLDVPHKFAGTARNLSVTLTPDKDDFTHIVAKSQQSSFILDGRETSDIGFDLQARASDQGAQIDELKLDSPLLSAKLKGQVNNWQDFAYTLDAVADIRTREVARLFAPQTRISGSTHFEGRVEGRGVEYQAKGKLSGNDLTAEGIQIQGFNINADVTGKADEYDARHEIAFRQLDAAGFRVNRVLAAGKIFGNGEDFSWLGNFRAGEIRSKDFRASDVSFRDAKIKGSFAAPDKAKVSGRFRVPLLVTADVPIGNLSGELTATRDEITIPNFTGSVFGGTASGKASIRTRSNASSNVEAILSKLNLDQAGAVAASKRLPLRGTADGRVNLSWQGNDYRSATGTVNLQFTGATLKQEDAPITDENSAKNKAAKLIEGLPVNGTLNLIASNRRLRLENTVVQTGRTKISVSGDIGWDRQGALDVSLDAPDSAELKTLAIDLAKSFGVADATLGEFDRNVILTDQLGFNGRVTGALDDPQIEGRFSLGGLIVNDEPLGALTGLLSFRDDTVQITEGRLAQSDGGNIEFSSSYPLNVENGATAKLKINRYPIETLVRQFITFPIAGAINGEAALEGLPGAIRGNADFNVNGAKFQDRHLDELTGRVSFNNGRVELENLKLRSGETTLSGLAGLTINSDKNPQAPPVKNIRLNLKGSKLDIGEIVSAYTEATSPVTGKVNLDIDIINDEFNLTGERGRIFDQLKATITSDELRYRNQLLGKVVLHAEGRDSRASLDLKADLLGQSYTGNGMLDLGDPFFPLNAAIDLKEVALEPVLTLLAGDAVKAGGRASGQIRFAGNLLGANNGLQIETALSQLYFDISDYRLTAQPPVKVKIGTNQIDVGAVQFSGANTNLAVKGSFALTEQGRTDFSLNGDVNAKILQSFAEGLYADGLIRIQAAAKGTYKEPRFSGTATLQNGSLRGADFPLAMTNANGRLRFTADQAQIEMLTAEVGNGKVEMNGGAAFLGLRPDRWRFQIKTSGVRVDYPRDTRTTLDGDLQLQGSRQLQVLSGIVNVRRAEYQAEANLFELIERITDEFRTESGSGNPTETGSLIPPTQFDIRVVANDSIVIRTKSLDVVGNAAMRLRGPTDDLTIGGRITITRGLIDDLINYGRAGSSRYRVTNGVIEFSGIPGKLPVLNIEAETEIAGYRIIPSFSGQVDKLKLAYRSEPPLPQNDVFNLLATGSLPNEAGGLANNTQALAQTSLATVAQVATQPLNRQIESNVTGRLFGLNRFSIDPLLTGRGSDPTARITVGRRVTRDLSITYSTNVASNQDQVILIEYRASDRLTFVASRSQDGTFGIDVRLRKRF
jgi:translocation and assembly module TamB